MGTKKPKIKWIGWLSGVFVMGTLGYVIFVPKSVSVDVVEVRRGTFDETIASDGIVRSRELYTVGAFAIGDIKRVALKVGDPVRKGSVITELAWDAEYVPVRSPISGVVSKVYRETAGPIQRGESIVEIVDPEQLEIVAFLLTNDAIRVKIGNPVEIQGIEGGSPIRARVIRVSKAGYTKQSALGVEEERTEVIMSPEKESEGELRRLGHNFHVDMIIRISTERNALKLPVGTLFREGDAWAVYKVDKNRARKKTVETLKRSTEEVMVGSGLNEGDFVVLYPGDLIKDGTKIHPK